MPGAGSHTGGVEGGDYNANVNASTRNRVDHHKHDCADSRIGDVEETIKGAAKVWEVDEFSLQREYGNAERTVWTVYLTKDPTMPASGRARSMDVEIAQITKRVSQVRAGWYTYKDETRYIVERSAPADRHVKHTQVYETPRFAAAIDHVRRFLVEPYLERRRTES